MKFDVRRFLRSLLANFMSNITNLRWGCNIAVKIFKNLYRIWPEEDFEVTDFGFEYKNFQFEMANSLQQPKILKKADSRKTFFPSIFEAL